MCWRAAPRPGRSPRAAAAEIFVSSGGSQHGATIVADGSATVLSGGTTFNDIVSGNGAADRAIEVLNGGIASGTTTFQ